MKPATLLLALLLCACGGGSDAPEREGVTTRCAAPVDGMGPPAPCDWRQP